MQRMMHNPQDLKVRQYATSILEQNKLLTFFPGADESKVIPEEDLNAIFLHTAPHGWSKQAIMLGFDFNSYTFCPALNLFEQMETSEGIHEGESEPFENKQPTRAYATNLDGLKKGRRGRLA